MSIGRGAVKASGNPWYEARINAAKWDDRLMSREGASELLGMSVSAVSDAELGLTKVMPVDKAVMMADVYNAPELLNYYCIHECPIGCRRAISDASVEIERAAVKLSSILRMETVKELKHTVEDIALDGVVSDDEMELFGETIEKLREVSKIISELEIIREKHMKKGKQNGCWVGRENR